MRESFGIVSVIIFLLMIIAFFLMPAIGDVPAMVAERIFIIGFGLSISLAIVSKGKWRKVSLIIHSLLLLGFILIVILLMQAF